MHDLALGIFVLTRGHQDSVENKCKLEPHFTLLCIVPLPLQKVLFIYGLHLDNLHEAAMWLYIVTFVTEMWIQ